MTVRIEDVATGAKVSTATVSRALRGLPGVSAHTRERVRAVAADMGYTPSHSASALASGRTGSVGVVMPHISRWFFSTLLEAGERSLRQANFDALVYSLPDAHGPIRVFDPNVLRSKVDAVAVLSLLFDDTEVAALNSLNVPAVFVSVRQPGYPHVGIDDRHAARQACTYLISLGHRCIGYIATPTRNQVAIPEAVPTTLRMQGWRQALQEHGLDAQDALMTVTDTMRPGSGYEAANVLLDRCDDMTAILASSDEVAMGAIHAVRSRGLTVGRDISVIGIDGHDLDDAFGLSTVAQPVQQEGACAAKLLLERIAHRRSAGSVIYPTCLVERESTGPAPETR